MTSNQGAVDVSTDGQYNPPFVSNARARSLLPPCMRCNLCIAMGTHVHVRC
jgi:hypothetical protein